MRIPELTVVCAGIPGLTLVLMSPSTLAFFDQDNDDISDCGAPENISEQPSTIPRVCHQLVKL